MTACRFSRWRISAILDFRGPIMGSLKSPCTTSYRSSIDTIALNCLVFEKIAFLHFGDRQTSRQTDRKTNRWTHPLHEAALAVASGGLIIHSDRFAVSVNITFKFTTSVRYIYVDECVLRYEITNNARIRFVKIFIAKRLCAVADDVSWNFRSRSTVKSLRKKFRGLNSTEIIPT